MKQIVPVVVFLLAGCATGQKMANAPGEEGFFVEKTGERAYKLTYGTNGLTNSSEALTLWLGKAKEICKSERFWHNAKETYKESEFYNPLAFRSFKTRSPIIVGDISCPES